MGNINILTSDIYNLISAGEVIETPVGALKEIVENAIDADCNGVSIVVENGGFGLISVSDDGTGMLTEDVEKAFLKHATSKLLEADDLFSIGTLGFRGEALPSIAAVSRVKLTTRSIKEDVGVSVTVENGQIVSKDYV
ncbi:MAG: ATP-binding protein, partial [Clostridia bacterium]|nr:ATP-binding protein [Clostridia bacterium]